MIGDAPIAIEQLEEGLPRLRIDEARLIERQHQAFGRIGRISEDRFEMWVGSECRSVRGPEGAHVDTLVHGMKQTREGEIAPVSHGA